MSEQEKKRQRIYDLINAKTRPKEISEIIEVSLWPPFSSDLALLDYAVWGILENKINATSSPNIGSLKTANEEEWDKMSVKFISICKLSQRRVDIIVGKNSGHIE